MFHHFPRLWGSRSSFDSARLELLPGRPPEASGVHQTGRKTVHQKPTKLQNLGSATSGGNNLRVKRRKPIKV